MNNLILFVNEFISYVMIFVIFIACMVAAGFVGIKLRKSQDAKKAAETTNTEA